MMDAARESSVSMFDTAGAYAGGDSERWIGEWLASRRAHGEIALTTKVGGPVAGGRGLSRAHLRRQIDASLSRLGVERIELYLAHGPDDSVPIEETVGAFDELVRAGKIGAYGVSNVDAGQLRAAADAGAPVNVQMDTTCSTGSARPRCWPPAPRRVCRQPDAARRDLPGRARLGDRGRVR